MIKNDQIPPKYFQTYFYQFNLNSSHVHPPDHVITLFSQDNKNDLNLVHVPPKTLSMALHQIFFHIIWKILLNCVISIEKYDLVADST